MELLVKTGELTAEFSAEALLVPEFDRIKRRDRGSDGDSQGRTKIKAKKFFAFIYFYCHPHSNYIGYVTKPEDVREFAIKKDLHIDEDWKLGKDEDMQKAIAKYREIAMTPEERLLVSAYNALGKLESYFDSLDLDLRDEGKPVYSARDLVFNLSNMGKVMDGLDKLKEQVRLQKEKDSKTRKGVQPTPWNTTKR
jgi:hypothetical protein